MIVISNKLGSKCLLTKICVISWKNLFTFKSISKEEVVPFLSILSKGNAKSSDLCCIILQNDAPR